MKSPMRTVSFKLPDELDEALTELARQRSSSRSMVVREAIEAYAAGGRKSVTAAIDEVVTPVDGPGDLSTNPKYMAGYGK